MKTHMFILEQITGKGDLYIEKGYIRGSDAIEAMRALDDQMENIMKNAVHIALIAGAEGANLEYEEIIQFAIKFENIHDSRVKWYNQDDYLISINSFALEKIRE